ncbi:MAG: peptidylprolyl isomerase [Dehalococcoidales bacterium]|nr:peptidylprolyl isomerase [Dehalococcoidales bacterium]
MPQIKKRSAGNNPTDKNPSPEAANSSKRMRRTGFIITALVIVIILIVIGIGYYFSDNAKYSRIDIITVDDTSISMNYFIKRTAYANSDPFAMLEILTNELIIKQAAPSYGIEISEEEVDQFLRIVAQGESETISEIEFKEWYRQQVNESGFSSSEFRDMVRTTLITISLNDYLAERIPTVAEQVHLYYILSATYEEADNIRARWEAGEDFSDLAIEASYDEESKEAGGELGWIPRGVMKSELDGLIFDLSPGVISEVITDVVDATAEEPTYIYILFLVAEKDDAREIDDNSLQLLKDNAIESWLLEEMNLHELNWNFNSEIHGWINYQLSK